MLSFGLNPQIRDNFNHTFKKMAIGWKNDELVDGFENDEEVFNGAVYTSPVDNRSGKSDQNSRNIHIVQLILI